MQCGHESIAGPVSDIAARARGVVAATPSRDRDLVGSSRPLEQHALFSIRFGIGPRWPTAGCEAEARVVQLVETGRFGSQHLDGTSVAAALRVFGKPTGDAVAAITDEVRQIVSQHLKIPLDRLTPDTALQDLGVESLDLIEMVFALEERFDISIPFNANEVAAAGNGTFPSVGLGKLETIEQISLAVKERVAAKTSA